MLGRALLNGAAELRSATLAAPTEWLTEAFGASQSIAGPAVDEQSALRLAAVGACVRVVSEDIGKVPCIIYERTDARGSRERAVGDTYAPALGLAPNPEMSAMEYWENMTAYGMLWSHAEAYIERLSNGSICLWPLPPNRIERVRAEIKRGGEVAPGPIVGINVMLDSGEKRFVKWSDVISVRAFGYDSKTPIARHKETIGLGLAGEEFGSRFFGQGGSAGGFITMPVEATQQQADRTEARYRAKHEGLERSHLVGVLEGGAGWQEVGMPLKDAQYIDGRKFTVEEICRIFRVPPHKIASLDRATFTNIEHQSIEYVVDAVSTWCVRHEQAHRVKLFDQSKYGSVGERYPEFLLDGLLRGDTKSRYEAYSSAIINGWMNRSEVRARENLPHFEELDEFLTPLNMAPAGEEPDEPDEPAPAVTLPPIEPLDEENAVNKAEIARLAAILSRNGYHGNGSQSEEPDTVTS